MSEYQRLHFVACDRVLDDDQLAFMREQSSRAELTRRSFDNEYHFGDFHGDAEQMLRRGFDAHLHFADFGIRRLLFRLPAPPMPSEQLTAYGSLGGVRWESDGVEGGPGVLEIQPADTDAETYLDDWEFDPSEAIAALPAVRVALLRGDPRPLYLGWLAGARWCDRDAEEEDGPVPLPPIPAGLAALPPAVDTLLGFFSIAPARVAAAAEAGPDAPPPGEPDARRAAETFAAGLPAGDLRVLAADLLTRDPAAVAAALRVRQRGGAAPATAWPLRDDPRTLTDLLTRAAELEADAAREARAANERRREAEAARAAERHAEAVARARRDPEATLARIERGIGKRTTAAYLKSFTGLSVLHEALGPAAARRAFTALAARLDAREKRPVGLLKMMREQGWVD